MTIAKKWKARIHLTFSTFCLAAAALFVRQPVIELLGLLDHESVLFLLGCLSITAVALTVRYLPDSAADERCDKRIHEAAITIHRNVVDAHIQPVRDLLVKLHHLHLDVATDRKKEHLLFNIKQAIKEVEKKLTALEAMQDPEIKESYTENKL